MNKLFLVGFGAVLGFGACKLLDRARTRVASRQPVAPFAVHQDALPTVEADGATAEATANIETTAGVEADAGATVEADAQPVSEGARAPSRSVKRSRKPAASATTAPRRVRRKSKR